MGYYQKLGTIIFVFILSYSTVRAQDSLNMELLFHWDDNAITGSSSYNNSFNEIWGYAADGREYAIIGTTLGTHIWDITDPANSVQVDFVAGAQQGLQVVHRDYHDYAGYLYMVCQEGASTVQIADLGYLPDSVHVVYDSDEMFRGAHNIFIDTATAKLYAMDAIIPGVGYVGIMIYSLENPEVPEFLAQHFVGTDVHDIFARNDTVYMNMGPMSVVNIYDTSDPEELNFIGQISDYTDPGYNHSGYLNEAGNIYVLGDETWGSPVKIFDVSDLTDPQELATVTSGIHNNSIAHNQILHNNMLFSSYYYDGIYVWNLEDPANPFLAGFYDTSTQNHQSSYHGAWGVYPFLPSGNILVSDMQSGLWVFNLDSSTSGLTDHQKNKVSVYPNPATEILNIYDFHNYKTVGIYSAEGKLVLHEQISGNNSALNISDLAPGFYSGRLTGDEPAVFKFLKL